MTQYYIGSKQIVAWPEDKNGTPGYAVQYPDGYQSWSPAETFEAFYLPMGEEADPTRVNGGMVEDFVASTSTHREGNHTVVHATLRNGFSMIETSACVDSANYDENIGHHLAMQKIHNRIWEHLGFLLATARHGIRKEPATEPVPPGTA